MLHLKKQQLPAVTRSMKHSLSLVKRPRQSVRTAVIMDVIGSYGYSGQPLVYLDADKFCYVTGCGIVIVDQSGPNQMIWRHENGISTISSHVLQKWLAIAPKVAQVSIEILDISLQKTLFSIKNPSSVAITDMNFSKDASRLVALTDIAEHKVLLWNLSSRELLHTFLLEEHLLKCSFNPGNQNMIVLSDSENICIGVYNELLGKYDLRLTKVEVVAELEGGVESSQDEKTMTKDTNEIHPISYTNPIGFICWASLSTLIVGSSQGFYFEVNFESKKALPIANGHSQRGDARPTSAILTSEYLVVGAADGTVKWFQRKLIVAFLSRASTQAIDPSYFKPVKIARLQRNKSNLMSLNVMSVNPLFMTIACGSVDGTIHMLSLEMAESTPVDEEYIPESDDPIASYLSSLPAVPDMATVEPFMELQTGAVLCSRSLYIQVMQTQDGIPLNEYSGTLSLLITGSHCGTITFWRTPVPMGENDTSSGSLGIRKSTPYMPRVMFRRQLSYSEKFPAAAVQMEVMSAVCKHGGRLLAIGTSDGCLELWLVEAFESEDEDGEGDEEEGLFYIKVSTVLRKHLLHVPVSIISSCEARPLVAVGSTHSETVYVLSFHNAQPLLQIVSTFSIIAEQMPSELVGLPSACCWQKNTLWILSDRGFFICVTNLSEKPHINDSSDTIGYVATSLNNIGSSAISATGLLILPKDHSGRVIISSALPASTTSNDSKVHGDMFSSYIDHDTEVISISRCIQGGTIACGCADGSIYIWKVSFYPGRISATIVNKYRVHSAAVISLEFSIDSSMLLSCAADGSALLTYVDKMHSLKKDPRISSIKISEEVVRDSIFAEESQHQDSRLWMDVHRDNLIVTIRDKFGGTLGSVKDALSNLREKLDRLLENNSKCDELEKMDVEEFVVDVSGRELRMSNNEIAANEVRRQYAEMSLKNELLSARIRQAYWDINEVQSRCILSISEDSSKGPIVWSFPIKRYTDIDVTRLERYQHILSKMIVLYFF